MRHRTRNRPLRCAVGLLLAAALSSALAACGGGSDQATNLLRQTFAGKHRISSGDVALALTVSPSGPSTQKGPITLSLIGPFQNLGPGRLPASSFNIGLAAMGTGTSVTLTSTGTTGYVTFQGQSYRLPPATFDRLESSFGALGSTSAGGGSGVLGRLGIQPQRWLVDPQIVGDEGVDGVNTTHIRAGIDVDALLGDLSTFLKRAASLGVAGVSSFPGGIPPATRRRIAGEVKNTSFNVWTGVGDKALRRLEIGLTVPVSGELSALLGRAAAIGLTLEYANLNQPQRITAPTRLLPYSQFQDKLRVLLTDVEGSLATGAAAPSGSGAGGSTAGGSGQGYQPYTNCINKANGNLSQMQQCAPLLNGQ
jgi:hypothetical protein